MPIGKEIQREAEIGKRLFSAIFEPILPQIASTTNKLILAADGDLYRLPFAILPTNDRGERIIDLFQIETLTAARDLRRRYEKTFHPPTTPLIVADPDYECDVTESTGDLQMERLT
jgi:hypothetical protein